MPGWSGRCRRLSRSNAPQSTKSFNFLISENWQKMPPAETGWSASQEGCPPPQRLLLAQHWSLAATALGVDSSAYRTRTRPENSSCSGSWTFSSLNLLLRFHVGAGRRAGLECHTHTEKRDVSEDLEGIIDYQNYLQCKANFQGNLQLWRIRARQFVIGIHQRIVDPSTPFKKPSRKFHVIFKWRRQCKYLCLQILAKVASTMLRYLVHQTFIYRDNKA